MEPQSKQQQKWQEPKISKKPTTQNLLQLQLLTSWAAEDEEPLGSSAHLGDSAEVEDTLVFEAGQVGEDVGDVVEGVGDELIEALHGHVDVLWLGKIRELLGISAPNLNTKISVCELERALMSPERHQVWESNKNHKKPPRNSLGASLG